MHQNNQPLSTIKGRSSAIPLVFFQKSSIIFHMAIEVRKCNLDDHQAISSGTRSFHYQVCCTIRIALLVGLGRVEFKERCAHSANNSCDVPEEK
jgi:hypothetical protein